MCPDKELISAFHDNETDDRWSSEIQVHIENCPDCSVNQENLQKLSVFLNKSEVPGETEIKNRVYAAIERRQNVIYPEPFWKKHFEVSFSAIIGAAAVVVVLCAAFIFGLWQYSSSGPVVAEEIKEESGDITMQLISLEDAAAYILSDDSGFDVLITIPASEGLSFSGEPQLIREADYKRGQ